MLEVLIALSLAILIGNIIAHKTRLTPAIVLIVLGLVLGLIPAHQLHEVQELGLPPHVILEIFLPIMLFWEARNTSWREIRKFMRGIILTGTLLVIFTAAVIAWTLNFFFGTDWGVALIIGAALAPTDATAVATLNGKLPKSSITILKAESLINDGTTLVIFALALQVANGHHLSLGPTTGMFFYSFAVGIFVGLAVGWAGNKIRAYLTNPMYFTVFMVTTPFIAFLISEQLEIAEGFKGSGVVAVVVAAIYLTYNGPDTITAQNRFYGLPIWAFISFVLNGALFVLVGVQLPEVWRAMDEVAQHNHYSAMTGVMVVLVAWVTSVAARFVFLNVSVGIIRALDRSEKQRRLRSTFRGRVVSTFAGLRGGISLAVALSVPADVEGREFIIFVVAAVVILSMVVQGLALPVVIRWAKIPSDDSETREMTEAARLAWNESYKNLDELAEQAKVSPEALESIREECKHRTRLYNDHHDTYREISSMEARPDGSHTATQLEQENMLRLAIIDNQRQVLKRLRNEGKIDMNVLHVIQERLDIEEVRVLGPVELE